MAQQLQERIDKRDKIEEAATEWEKIFASYPSDKGLITRKYREPKLQKHQ
jgi:hypothetical protein